MTAVPAKTIRGVQGDAAVLAASCCSQYSQLGISNDQRITQLQRGLLLNSPAIDIGPICALPVYNDVTGRPAIFAIIRSSDYSMIAGALRIQNLDIIFRSTTEARINAQAERLAGGGSRLEDHAPAVLQSGWVEVLRRFRTLNRLTTLTAKLSSVFKLRLTAAAFHRQSWVAYPAAGRSGTSLFELS